MITNLMDVYKIVTQGEEVTVTDVRRGEDGIPTIVMHHRHPAMSQESAQIQPPSNIQSIFPNISRRTAVTNMNRSGSLRIRKNIHSSGKKESKSYRRLHFEPSTI